TQSQYPVSDAVLMGTKAISALASAAKVYFALARRARDTRIAASAADLGTLDVHHAKWRVQILVQFAQARFRNGEKYLNNFRIELTPGTPPNLLPRMIHGQRATVRTVRNHCIQRIGDRENPRSQRDRFAAQAAGIPCAIEKLLVGEHNFCGVAQERDTRQHV